MFYHQRRPSRNNILSNGLSPVVFVIMYVSWKCYFTGGKLEVKFHVGAALMFFETCGESIIVSKKEAV